MSKRQRNEGYSRSTPIFKPFKPKLIKACQTMAVLKQTPPIFWWGLPINLIKKNFNFEGDEGAIYEITNTDNEKRNPHL